MQRVIAALLFLAVIVGIILLVWKSPSNTKPTSKITPTTSITAGPKPTTSQTTITIDGHTFIIEVARTEAEKEKGLSDRDSLPVDHGMLFPFGTPGDYGFWMKGMRFPLDIIYLKNNKIVTILNDLQPQKNATITPPVFHSASPADTVLEINAGLAKKYNIKLGDTASINQ